MPYTNWLRAKEEVKTAIFAITAAELYLENKLKKEFNCYCNTRIYKVLLYVLWDGIDNYSDAFPA